MHVYTGTDSIDLIDHCLAMLADHSRFWPDKRAFFIVPESLKADIERRYLEQFDPGHTGLLMAEVLSFNRLTYRLFSLAGGLAHKQISRLGKTVLIQKLLQDKQKDFQMFSAYLNRHGFAEEIEKVLADFYRYNITADDLEAVAADLDGSQRTKKFSDFAKMLNLLDEDLIKLGLEDGDRAMELACKLLQDPSPQQAKELAFLEDTSIWIVGFGEERDFTSQEYQLIQALAGRVEEVTISVCCPDVDDHDPLYCSLYRSGQTCLKNLYRFFPKMTLTALDRLGPGYQEGQHARALKMSLFQAEGGQLDPDKLCLVKTSGVRQELSFVAGEIKRLLATNPNYRRRDIGIALADFRGDLARLKSVFRDFGLDSFIVSSQAVRQTVLFRYLEAWLAIAGQENRVDRVLEMLRTGLCFPAEDFQALSLMVDRLENYFLARGLQHYRLPDETEPELREFCLQLVDPQIAGARGLAQYPEATAKAHYLQRYLTGELDPAINIRQQIDDLVQFFRREGALDNGLALTASWNILWDLLTHVSDYLDTNRLGVKSFSQILTKVMAKMVPSTIPVGIDLVRVGSLTHMQHYPCKVLFVVNLNKQNFPEGEADEGLLTNNDRLFIEGFSQKNLPNRRRDQLAKAEFICSQVLSRPTDLLYLSSSVSEEENESVVFSNLRAACPETYVRLRDGAGPDVRWLARSRFGRYMRSWLGLVGQTGLTSDYKAWLDLWQADFRGRESDSVSEERLDVLEEEIPQIILPKTLIDLGFAVKDHLSISAVQLYNSCPYRFFANQLLGLRERPIYLPESRERGSLVHAMLELALNDLKAKISSWDKLLDPVDKAHSFTHWQETITSERALHELYHQALTKTGLVAYAEPELAANMGARARRLVKNILVYNQQLIASGGYLPYATEWFFDTGKADLRLPLQLNDRDLYLRGVIDRVDLNPTGQFRILDYKTGSQNFDFNKLYHGLDIQLGVYQYIWQLAHPQQSPGELFFLKTSDLTGLVSGAFTPPQEDLETRLKAQKPLNGPDHDRLDLDLVSEFSYWHLGRAAREIAKGDISPRPTSIGNAEGAACRYCPYHSLCRRDAYNKRRIKVLPPLEVKRKSEDLEEKFKLKMTGGDYAAEQ